MTRRFHIAKPAAEELVAAIRWYEERRAGLGGEFYDAVVRAMDRTAAMPEAGSPIGTLGVRRMLVAGFPYQIVYRVEAGRHPRDCLRSPEAASGFLAPSLLTSSPPNGRANAGRERRGARRASAVTRASAG